MFGPTPDVFYSIRSAARTSFLQTSAQVVKLGKRVRSNIPKSRTSGISLLLFLVVASLLAIATIVYVDKFSPETQPGSPSAEPALANGAPIASALFGAYLAQEKVEEGKKDDLANVDRVGGASSEQETTDDSYDGGTGNATQQSVPAADDKSNVSRPTLSARSNRTEAPAQAQGGALTLEQRFIADVAEAAQLSQQQTGVPASVTIAQAILESDLGRSRLSREANNYFGIKARAKPGPAGVIYIDTWESIGGRDVTVREAFRAYHNMLESFIDHGMFFLENARYALAMQNVGSPRDFARLIHRAGYATDPKYSDKLIALMDKFNLYAYDVRP